MKKTIYNNLKENNETTTNLYETIYIIDDLYISGEFDCGSRGLDHNNLIGNGVTWDDLLLYGTVIVPETETYISDDQIDELDSIGYTRLPLNDNHIVGYKE